MDVEIVAEEESPGYRREHALELAAARMALGDSAREAAEYVGVSERTIKRWKHTPEWQKAYAAAQSEVITRGRSGLVGLVGLAVRVIGDHLREEDEDRAQKMARKVDTAWKVLRHVGVELEVAQAERGKTILSRLPPPGSVLTTSTTSEIVADSTTSTTSTTSEIVADSTMRREVRRGW